MKKLFDAIPPIPLPEDLVNSLKDVMVTNISMHKDGKKILIEATADEKVNLADVSELEDILTMTLFKDKGIKVKIDINGFFNDKPEVTPIKSKPQVNSGSTFRRKSKGVKIEPGKGFGYDFNDKEIRIIDITDEIGEVVISGDVISFESRPNKSNDNTLLKFVITDYTDSIYVKLFAKPDSAKDLIELLSSNPSLKIKGEALYDSYDKEVEIMHIKGIKIIEKTERGLKDECDEKRVELHCHTKMSEMDGVTSASDIVKKAAEFGHKAIAITDHGVVYAFPEAFHTKQDLAKKGVDIKVIYGCEGYLVDDKPGDTIDDIQKARMYHIILLVKNETGRVNLYKIVSEAHLKYYKKRPRIPRSLIEENREGLIIGSACEAGELIRAIVEGESVEEIEKRANFYDYLEVQPIGNNAFMKRDTKYDIKTDDDLRAINDIVISLGEKLRKPVVATSDVHFVNPEDEIYRRIIMAGMKYEDADIQAPLYLHTTQEMLDEFAYLGEDKAKEIVIDNTNMIADLCDDIAPVRPDKCPPIIEGSDENLRKICYEKAHSMYGEEIPEIVKSRLDKELDSIIGNGYAVMYIFAQLLVKKANEDGYMVGSRGSVGSSLAATMADITEVNPLPPHYLCPNCHYSDFDSPEVMAYKGKTGYDMPDRCCPVCGADMRKEGTDIPFETFLGFNGDKEPDIDLNFSGEYQSKAHAYTAELFGDGYTFRAGTIAGVADKTAYGYVRNYFEDRGINKRNCEVERLIKGCIDIRRSTGQHPGGIIVMPKGENIYSFTPIQHPANDMTTDTITTHFDYHSIDQNLLKFDILGHDDPTMMHQLQKLTGINPVSIPLNDPNLYSLFKSTEALGIEPDDMGGTPLGTLGIPEFNTNFAMQMLIEAKPDGFADLVNVAGLAHGTDVWMDNARDLILNGTADLQTAICTRDGIMLDLIKYGIDPAKSFKIMESVRKGKVASGAEKNWPEMKEDMINHGIPQWYIESCEKIKYMFPKAHAVAYVMMALRVAYFKIYHPAEFYSAYFGIRASGFDYEKLCLGKDVLNSNLETYKDNEGVLSKTEADFYNKTLRVAQEMYARGYEFAEIDIYKAEPVHFKVVDGKVMPGLTSIAGLGEKVAETIVAEAAKSRFISKEDFIQRTKVSGTLADKLQSLGLLGDIPDSNQLSLFDFM